MRGDFGPFAVFLNGSLDKQRSIPEGFSVQGPGSRISAQPANRLNPCSGKSLISAAAVARGRGINLGKGCADYMCVCTRFMRMTFRYIYCIWPKAYDASNPSFK